MGNSGSDWESLIRFVQGWEESNNLARAKDRAKKKVTRELQSLKTSMNYDKNTDKMVGSCVWIKLLKTLR